MSLFEERVELEREDGVALPGLRITPDFEPAESCNGAGVLVVAGEWGLGPDDEARVVRPLAELGFFVVALDLVRGRRAASAAEAQQRASGLDRGIAVDDLVAGLLDLRQLASGKLGVLGLDLGATVAVEAAAMVPQLDAVVHIGGPPPRAEARLARARAPILVHYATGSGVFGADDYNQLAARVRRGKAQLLGNDYATANAGFLHRPADDADREHATIAWDRTRDFLVSVLT